MELNLLRSLVTVIGFVVFIVIVVRAWRSSNAAAFAEAAALPFHDELPSGPKAVKNPTGDAA